MKQMKSFFCMLLAALLLSTAVSAQTKTVISTFTDVGDFRELVEGTGILGGTLFTSEGNSWGFGTLKRGDPGAASVGSSFALLLGGKAYTFYPSFNLKGYIKKVTVRAGGNLSQIYAYISGGGSGYVCEMGTVEVKSGDVKNYEIYVADSWGETSLADNVDASRSVNVKITPGSGSEATVLESITVEYTDELSDVATSGTIGPDYDQLKWEITGGNHLTISAMSGYGYMLDFELVNDPETGNPKPNTPWADFNITSVEIKEGVKTVGKYAFYGQTVNEVILPSTVNRINDNAFDGNQFSSVILPDELTSIGSDAFSNNNNLESITIPAKVSYMGYPVFGNCPALTSITVKDGNETFSSPNNCNAIIRKENKELAHGCKTTVIPGDVLSIGSDAFNGCNLENIAIPAGVTKIGSSAFYGCEKLKSVVLFDKVEAIEGFAFYFCSAMESLTIGSGLKSIGNYALFGLNKLDDVFCTADPDDLIWNGNDSPGCCKSDGSTKFHVKDPTAWQTKFPNAHVQFVAIGSAETKEGDVIGNDGVVDEKDVDALMSHLMGSTPAGFNAAAADVNKDGKVNVADIVALINIILNK